MEGAGRESADDDAPRRPDYQGARAMVYVILAVLFVVLAFALIRMRGRKAGRS